ncbi:helix-turn-helix domain-containing protein [Bacteroides caecigallinarum]|uniref:helix-turn-helix domain-containing protein n=1 Tax=Bacteroides caecigallinarum TaxID=1411144 RepID=UPI0019592A48|nr:helix-turn-helix domain-containing protein [Bacteroides caecigallinarum]MBM6890978.1 helix-turn-helix domain-containing protein [Bacteroides caecigallinarum]
MYVKLIISSSVSRFGTISFTCSRTILKWMRSCMTLFLVMLLFVGSLRAQKQDGYFGDSTLYALSMQMFDSIRTPAFFDMQRRGLERAVATGSKHFDYVFRSAMLSRYEMTGDKPGFLRAADELIAYYQAQADDSLLYSTWARRADRLLVWGDYVDAVLSLRGMADYARRHNHPFGLLNADFYFGQCYLSNGQDSVAARHYRQALDGAIRYGSPGLAARSGFNLVNILQGWGRYDEALALSDSLPAFIHQWEVMKGIAVNPVLRVQNAMYRLKVLISRADLPAATAWRDTMLLYNNMYADPSQQEELQYTLARYERLAGNNTEAERILRMLADYSRSRGNQARMARYYRSLADVLRAEGKYAEAADSYHLYAGAADSAQTAASNAQLNRLSRLYRLDELEQEKRVALAEQSRARTLAGSALTVAVLLLALCVLLVVHHRRLRQKNRELVARIRSQEEAERRAEEAARQAKTEQPADELSREVQLFRRLQELLADEEVLCRPRLGRDELADLLGTNRTYVADAVSACTEQHWSVSQYVAAVRVRRARYLIDNHPELSLGEICLSCGFQSQGTFTRAYRTFYGITPSEYRKFASPEQ